jgi:hypothetical protein
MLLTLFALVALLQEGENLSAKESLSGGSEERASGEPSIEVLRWGAAVAGDVTLEHSPLNPQ